MKEKRVGIPIGKGLKIGVNFDEVFPLEFEEPLISNKKKVKEVKK